MIDKKYSISKNDIYAGQVVLVKHVYRYRYLDGTTAIDVDDYQYLRTMLFTFDSTNKADDLLYNSNHYPILNKSDDNDCLRIQNGDIVVRIYYPLKDLLLDYNREYTYKDVKRIKDDYFNGSCYKDNKPLMGTSFEKYAFLDELGSHYPWEVIGNDLKICAFRPSRKEVVKRLK